MKKLLSDIFIIAILLLSFIALFPTVQSAEITVSKAGPITSIQQAINQADPFDTITVLAGLYNEQIIIDKSITLLGEDKSNTTITSLNKTCINIIANNVTIQGFTIKNSNQAISINNSDNCIMHDNTIRDCSYGIVINEQSNQNTIYYNNFVNNGVHAEDTSGNSWSFSGNGNYWDDYAGNDSNNNGIGDIPYNIKGNISQDAYPLMNPLTIAPRAEFYFSPSDPTTQNTITFYDISSDEDGEIVKWLWDFGDGVTNSNQQTTYSYSDNGNYLISLTVYDDLGASDTQIYEIQVDNVGPTAYFSYTPKAPMDIQVVSLKDESTDPDGKIIQRKWYVNDELLENGSVFSYTFPDDGTYDVKLQVMDDDNTVATHSEQIKVSNAGPIAGFSFYTDNGSIEKNVPIHFSDSSVDRDGEITSWSWDFGDSAKSTKPNPTHSYANEGVFTVSLTVEDDDGATHHYSNQVKIGLENDGNLLAGLSLFDIVIVAGIISAVVVVIIISKKYSI